VSGARVGIRAAPLHRVLRDVWIARAPGRPLLVWECDGVVSDVPAPPHSGHVPDLWMLLPDADPRETGES
jgi:hypothetical protein